MEARAQAGVGRVGERAGFVLPAVIIAMVLLTVVAVAALSTGREEQLAARAMRQSARAFYAAEAGLNEVWAGWASVRDTVHTLAPGDSLVLGWRTLPSGDSYFAVLQRLDNGGQPMLGLRVIGRDASPQRAERMLSLAFTTSASGDLKLGRCCDGAVTIRGEVDMQGGALVDGTDRIPPNWDGACEDPGPDKPGLIMADSTQLTLGDGDVQGDPPVMEDTSLVSSDFDQFGELSWDSLKTRANIVLEPEAEGKSEFILDGSSADAPVIQPSTTTLADGTEVCNTSDPYNWGSDDPTHPCYDYLPIVLVKGEVEVHHGYGQALVIIDWDEASGIGGEFELETDFRYNGVILGKGCVEVQKGAVFHGAIFVDSNYRNEELCGNDLDYDMNDNAPQVHWSQCAVNRAVEQGGLGDEAEPINPDLAPFASRAFIEVLR